MFRLKWTLYVKKLTSLSSWHYNLQWVVAYSRVLYHPSPSLTSVLQLLTPEFLMPLFTKLTHPALVLRALKVHKA
jgi:hypothetical protein